MRNTPPKQVLGIQALRMIAACLVVFTHSTFYTFERLDKRLAVWHQGTSGVDLFFVISGFVMIYASQKLLGLQNGWNIFAEQRIVRIVPLYWIVTSMKVMIVLLTTGFALHTILSPASAACSYLFLPARDLDGRLEPLVGVGWTLNLEMLFYALVTVALLVRVDILKFAGLILTALSVGFYFRRPTWPPIAFYLNANAFEFVLGMIIAKACISRIYIPKRAALCLIACGLFVLLLPTHDLKLPIVLKSGLLASLIVWSAASLESIDKFIPRFVLYLGDASYSIYLIHPFICPIVPTVLGRVHLYYPWVSVVLSVVLGVASGCILHEIIEIPMTAHLKKYLQMRHRQLVATV